MANPFFIPDQGLEGLDRVNRSIGTAGQLYNMKEHARLGDQQNQRLLEQQAYQKPYYEALTRKAKEGIPASTNPWDTGNLTRMKAKLQLNGVPVDQLRFLKELEPLAADQNVKYGDVASAVSSDWDRHRGGITEDLGVHASKLAAKAALLQPNDPERAKLLQEVDRVAKIQSAFDQLPQARVKEVLFPDIHREEANTRAALDAQRATERIERDKLKANPEWQAFNAYKNQALRMGKPEHEANLYATEQFGLWKSKMNKEGKIDNSNSRITNSIGINPKTNKEEYLMNDGSFSGVTPGKKPHDASTLDTKRLADMISNATESGKKEPSASDIELIGIEAAKHGYEFKPVTKTTKNRFLPDSEATTWQLVPKSGGGGATISTEQDLRKHLKDNGASDAYITEYVKRARKAGKI
jgi:hypothetical protein